MFSCVLKICWIHFLWDQNSLVENKLGMKCSSWGAKSHATLVNESRRSGAINWLGTRTSIFHAPSILWLSGIMLWRREVRLKIHNGWFEASKSFWNSWGAIDENGARNLSIRPHCNSAYVIGRIFGKHIFHWCCNPESCWDTRTIQFPWLVNLFYK